jgi:hypothetical protein
MPCYIKGSILFNGILTVFILTRNYTVFNHGYCCAVNLIPCSLTLHTAVGGTVRPLLGSRRHGQAMLYLFKKHTLLAVWVHCLSSSKPSITLLIMSLFAMNYFVRNVWHSSMLQCLSDTAECFELSDNVFETDSKRYSCLRCASPPWPACLFTPRATWDQVVWQGQYRILAAIVL